MDPPGRDEFIRDLQFVQSLHYLITDRDAWPDLADADFLRIRQIYNGQTYTVELSRRMFAMVQQIYLRAVEEQDEGKNAAHLAERLETIMDRNLPRAEISVPSRAGEDSSRLTEASPAPSAPQDAAPNPPSLRTSKKFWTVWMLTGLGLILWGVKQNAWGYPWFNIVHLALGVLGYKADFAWKILSKAFSKEGWGWLKNWFNGNYRRNLSDLPQLKLQKIFGMVFLTLSLGLLLLAPMDLLQWVLAKMASDPIWTWAPFYVLILSHLAYQAHQTFFKSPRPRASPFWPWLKGILFWAALALFIDTLFKYPIAALIQRFLGEGIVQGHKLDFARILLVPLAAFSYLWSAKRFRNSLAPIQSSPEAREAPTLLKTFGYYDIFVGIFLGASLGNIWQAGFLREVIDMIPVGVGTANSADLMLVAAATIILMLKDFLREGYQAVREKRLFSLPLYYAFILPLIGFSLGHYLTQAKYVEYVHLFFLGKVLSAFSWLFMFGAIYAMSCLTRWVDLLNEEIRKLAAPSSSSGEPKISKLTSGGHGMPAELAYA